ncbi:MAG TPA: putative lipid II flippase FtsW [Clostridiales bacterium]|nr:putative lipid II flippase FtsW [Clostridiales bacterium]
MEYENTRLADYTEDAAIGRGSFDLPFAILTLLLLLIGVVMVLSASYARAYYSSVTGNKATYYFVRQLVFAIGGVGVMFIVSKFPMAFYRRISPTIMGIALVTLLAVPFIGSKVNGARRWIDLGFTTFQPSEIAKVAVIMYFAMLICKYKGRMKTFRYGIVPFGGILILIVGLLVLEPHFSASVIIIAIGAVMLFLGGARLIWFIGGIAVAGGGLAIIMTFFPYASDRINAWRDPFAYMQGDGYQIVQSLYSIGSGGLLGLGLGQSRQKYLYLPEEHNDFIFSVICEELGFIGAIAILILFALLIIRGYWLAMHMRDRYSVLVTAGITTLLALQVILNVAVVTNLIPSTGISLPLFSYGGTALLIQLAEMGIVLSASRDIPAKVSG